MGGKPDNNEIDAYIREEEEKINFIEDGLEPDFPERISAKDKALLKGYNESFLKSSTYNIDIIIRTNKARKIRN